MLHAVWQLSWLAKSPTSDAVAQHYSNNNQQILTTVHLKTPEYVITKKINIFISHELQYACQL